MLRNIKKNLYYFIFSILKYFKYPTCKLYTNHIHPTAKIGKFVEIHKHCKIGKYVEIGSYTFINEYTRIDANTSKIGKYCSISHNVKIGMGPHPLNHISTSPVFYSKSRGYIKKDTYDEYKDKGYTEIGHDVFIAANVVIYAGVKIGNGSVIAAGTIVTKDVPPYCIVAGMPGKIIKKRFKEEIIDKILKSKWWDFDNKKLLGLHKTMNNPKYFLEELEKIKQSN